MSSGPHLEWSFGGGFGGLIRRLERITFALHAIQSSIVMQLWHICSSTVPFISKTRGLEGVGSSETLMKSGIGEISEPTIPQTMSSVEI